MFPHRTWSLSFYDMLALFGEFETHTPYDCTSTRQAKASIARLCDTWQDAIDDGQIPSKDHKDTITFFEFYDCCYPVQLDDTVVPTLFVKVNTMIPRFNMFQYASMYVSKFWNTKIQLLIILFPLKNAIKWSVLRVT